jgi:choline-sulfatase
MKRQPNIILCTCDQLRAFEVGCYGNPVIRTPHLDRLAAEGVRFETAVTTFPVCMAARSVLLSGQYNRTCTGGVGNVATPHGEGRVYFPQYPFAGRPHLKDPTLPEILHGRGYHTAAIGKWHIHTWPHDIGFDQYVIPRMNHVHTGQHFSENGGPEFVPDGYSVDYECERVEAFLEQQTSSDRPFFLFYNISPPHCPMSDAPEKYTTMYRPEDVPIRPNVDLTKRLPDQDHWFKVYRWDYRYYNFHLPYTEELPEDFTLKRVIAEYYGMTTWVDDAVGRMLAALDAHGLAEDTIVVFTSDHGDYLGSHGRVQKGDLHEESVRIPLIVRAPMVRRGETFRGALAAGSPVSSDEKPAATLDLGGNASPLPSSRVVAGHQGKAFRDAPDADNPVSSDAEPAATSGLSGNASPIPPSRMVAGMVDIAPTLLDLIGAEMPAHMHGRSLAPVLRGEQPAATDAFAVIETGHGVGIRTLTHLYGLRFVDGAHQLADAPYMFFDLAADPYQLHNLAGTNEQADIAARLDQALRAWDARTPWMMET